MAKPTTRRRAQATEPERVPESIFDSIDFTLPDHAGPARTQAKPGPSVEDLQGTVATLQAELRELKERAPMPMVQVAQPGPMAQPVVLKEPQLNMDGLPDPFTDREGYAREVLKRSEVYKHEMMQYEDARKPKAPDPVGDGDALWEDFVAANPEYSGLPERRMTYAVSEAMRDLAKRRVDVQRFMYEQPDRWFKKVTSTYDNIFGSPVDGDDDAERLGASETRSTPRRAVKAEEENADRSGGIFGGSHQPVQRVQRQTSAGDMIKDLQDIQRKTGYF